MMRAARKKLGLTTDQTIVIGDTMDTDILGSIQMGYKTILTLSGVSKQKDLGAYAYGPDMIIDSLKGFDIDKALEKLSVENNYSEF